MRRSISRYCKEPGWANHQHPRGVNRPLANEEMITRPQDTNPSPDEKFKTDPGRQLFDRGSFPERRAIISSGRSLELLFKTIQKALPQNGHHEWSLLHALDEFPISPGICFNSSLPYEQFESSMRSTKYFRAWRKFDANAFSHLQPDIVCDGSEA